MSGTESPSDPEETRESAAAIRDEYEWSSTAPSTAIIEALAIATDCKPQELDPLYDSVDPDAVNTLVRSNASKSTDSISTISFTHAGHDVTIHSDGELVVRPDTPHSESV